MNSSLMHWVDPILVLLHSLVRYAYSTSYFQKFGRLGFFSTEGEREKGASIIPTQLDFSAPASTCPACSRNLREPMRLPHSNQPTNQPNETDKTPRPRTTCKRKHYNTNVDMFVRVAHSRHTLRQWPLGSLECHLLCGHERSPVH